jgi:hypothetical protein
MHCFNEPHYISTIATRGATIASPRACRHRGGRCALRREGASPFIQACGWVTPDPMWQWPARFLFQTTTLLVTDVPTGQSKHIVTEASIADSARTDPPSFRPLVNSTTTSSVRDNLSTQGLGGSSGFAQGFKGRRCGAGGRAPPGQGSARAGRRSRRTRSRRPGRCARRAEAGAAPRRRPSRACPRAPPRRRPGA